LDDLSQQIATAAQQIEATPVVFEAIDQLMEGRLAPALEETDAAGRRLYANLARLDAAVTAMNSTFLFRNQEGALDELSAFLGSLLDDLQQLDRDFRRLESALLNRKSETVQALASSLQSAVEDMDARITKTQSRLEAVQTRLENLQTEMDAGRARLLNLITLLAVILTAVLVWLATSQVLAARYAWQVYREASARRQIEATASEQTEESG
jgi:DNA repair exonuclease SbcCD ATPase subunit